jgi:hypothetical protein
MTSFFVRNIIKSELRIFRWIMSAPKQDPVLRTFQSFLSLHKLVPEKNIPFYAHWASRFLAFCNKKAATDFSEAVIEFRQSLMTNQKIADWQIKQAEEAIRLYLANFKGNIKPKLAVDTTTGLDEIYIC